MTAKHYYKFTAEGKWTGMMSIELDKARNRHRESIRKMQIEGKFKQKRLLLKEIVHQDIKKQVQGHLATLKVFTLRREEDFSSVQGLIQLHKIMLEYQLVDKLSQNVTFTEEEQLQLKQRSGNDAFTWMDLLLLLMKQDWSQILIQQCSSIITNCAQQLKAIISSNLTANSDSIYFQLMRKIMQSYPYELVKDGSAKVIQNSLKVVYFISLSGNNSVFLYYLLNKTSPSLLKMLHLLYNNKQMLSIPEIRSEYIATSLTFASLVYYYRLENHQVEFYEKMKLNLKQVIENQLHLSQTKADFSNICEYIRILVNIDIFRPNKEEFDGIEGYIVRELAEENEVYFRMLQTVLYFGNDTLSVRNVRKIIECLFDVDSYRDSKKVSFRITLLQLIKYQIMNCGNIIREEDLGFFFEFWGVNGGAEKLMELAEVISTQSPIHMKLLFQIVSSILLQAQNPMQLIQSKFYSLLNYSQYRVMLQQLGYGVEDDQEL